MSNEPNPTGETPAAPKVEAPETPVTSAPAEVVEEPFDKDRAMKTIQNLRAIEKQAKQNEKELIELRAEKQKRAEAEMTEAQRLQKQADEAKAEAALLKADILRRDVVAETGLPPAFASRLHGDTKDELLADANELLKVLPTLTKAPKIPSTNPGSGSQAERDMQKRERLFGKQGSPFDLDTIKEKGGGVVWK